MKIIEMGSKFYENHLTGDRYSKYKKMGGIDTSYQCHVLITNNKLLSINFPSLKKNIHKTHNITLM